MAAIIAQMTRARRERLKRVEVCKHFVALGSVKLVKIENLFHDEIPTYFDGKTWKTMFMLEN